MWERHLRFSCLNIKRTNWNSIWKNCRRDANLRIGWWRMPTMASWLLWLPSLPPDEPTWEIFQSLVRRTTESNITDGSVDFVKPMRWLHEIHWSISNIVTTFLFFRRATRRRYYSSEAEWNFTLRTNFVARPRRIHLLISCPFHRERWRTCSSVSGEAK